jgi:hypothetical protein
MVRVFKWAQGYKIELTSEMNISFMYVCLLASKDLKELLGQTSEDMLWFRDIFSGTHHYELGLKTPANATLVASQEEKFKHYELASLNFELASQPDLRKSVLFRY